MEWPNHPGWQALADSVEVEEDDRAFVLHAIDCGELVVSTGRLVICDPFIWLSSWAHLDEPILQIPPGRHRVVVTQADVSGKGDGSHLRNAYATLLLSDAPEVIRIPLAAQPDGSLAPSASDEEGFAFGVDSGTGCFVDPNAVSRELPIGAWRDVATCPWVDGEWEDQMADPCIQREMADEEWWNEHVFGSDDGDGWFARINDETHLAYNMANLRLPLAEDDANIVIFGTGWGDGFYAVIGGYDAAGALARVHVDLQIVAPRRPFWLGRPPGYDDDDPAEQAPETVGVGPAPSHRP